MSTTSEQFDANATVRKNFAWQAIAAIVVFGGWVLFRPPPSTSPAFAVPTGQFLIELISLLLISGFGLMGIRRGNSPARFLSRATIVVTIIVVYQGVVRHRNGMSDKDRQIQQQAIVEIEKLGGKATIMMKGRIKPVGSVEFDGTKIGNDDLVHVERFSEMFRLSLKNTSISDAALSHLEGLTNLHELYLNDTHVTGPGLIHLKALDLHGLTLNGSRITDAGLSHLKNLKVHGLYLDRTAITDAGLVHLKGMKIRTLSLNETQVTDAGLRHLKEMTTLSRLSLRSTNVSDAGLEYLKGLPNLIQLNLQKSQVTDISALQAALPRCEINL